MKGQPPAGIVCLVAGYFASFSFPMLADDFLALVQVEASLCGGALDAATAQVVPRITSNFLTAHTAYACWHAIEVVVNVLELIPGVGGLIGIKARSRNVEILLVTCAEAVAIIGRHNGGLQENISQTATAVEGTESHLGDGGGQDDALELLPERN